MRLPGLWVPWLALAVAPAPALSERATSALVSSTSGLGGSILFEVDLTSGAVDPLALREPDGEGGTRPRHRHVFAAAALTQDWLVAIDGAIPTDAYEPSRSFPPPAIVLLHLPSRLVLEQLRIEPVGIDPQPGLDSAVSLGGLAIEPDLRVLVLHHDRSAPQPVVSLLRVDLASGELSTLASGGDLCVASNLVLETPESVLLACGSYGTARVVRVRLEDGEQVRVAEGSALLAPTEVALHPEGGILVIGHDPTGPFPGSDPGRLLHVGPGGASVLAMGGLLHTPWTLAPDGGRHVIVGTELPLDTELGIEPIGGLVRVDLDSGEQTLVFEDSGFRAGEQFATMVLLPEASTTAQGVVALATLLVLGPFGGGYRAPSTPRQ